MKSPIVQGRLHLRKDVLKMRSILWIVGCILILGMGGMVVYNVLASHSSCDSLKQTWIDECDDYSDASWGFNLACASLVLATGSGNPASMAIAIWAYDIAVDALRDAAEERDTAYQNYQNCLRAHQNKCPGFCCDSTNRECFCRITAGYPPPYRCPCFPSGSGSGSGG